jgi:hypothetical protein
VNVGRWLRALACVLVAVCLGLGLTALLAFATWPFVITTSPGPRRAAQAQAVGTDSFPGTEITAGRVGPGRFRVERRWMGLEELSAAIDRSGRLWTADPDVSLGPGWWLKVGLLAALPALAAGALLYWVLASLARSRRERRTLREGDSETVWSPVRGGPAPGAGKTDAERGAEIEAGAEGEAGREAEPEPGPDAPGGAHEPEHRAEREGEEGPKSRPGSEAGS